MIEKVKNIWTLNKDQSIKAILLMLQHEVGPDGFILLDEGRLSDKAALVVSSRNPNELAAYIYSYAQRQERYGLDLEFPNLIATQGDDQTIRLNDLSADEVLENVIDHLELERCRVQ